VNRWAAARKGIAGKSRRIKGKSIAEKTVLKTNK
jgi:hypothetical protein